MDDERIQELIKEKQVNGSMSCKTAMDIAEEAGASNMKIGRLLNEMNIKVRACQLGCFK